MRRLSAALIGGTHLLSTGIDNTASVGLLLVLVFVLVNGNMNGAVATSIEIFKADPLAVVVLR